MSDKDAREETKCVPLNPTPEMLMAGRKRCAADVLGPHMGPNIENIWRGDGRGRPGQER